MSNNLLETTPQLMSVNIKNQEIMTLIVFLVLFGILFLVSSIEQLPVSQEFPSTLEKILNEIDLKLQPFQIISQKLDSLAKSLEKVETACVNPTNNLNSSETILFLESKISKQENKIVTLTQTVNSLTSSVTELQNSLLRLSNNRDLDVFKFERLRFTLADFIQGFWTTPNIVLYNHTDHEGTSERIYFGDCPPGSCCKNLGELSAQSESMSTNIACVILYYDRDCKSYPNGNGFPFAYFETSTTNHGDFGTNKNKFKSISTCY